MLSEKPSAPITAKVPTSDTGIATAGTRGNALEPAGERANRIDSPQTRQGGPEREYAPRKENGSDE